MSTPSKIRVTQVRSTIGRKQDQRQSLRGLGIRKMNQTVVLENTPSVRGMIKKVIHLVEFEELND